jgi:hypothetical protein
MVTGLACAKHEAALLFVSACHGRNKQEIVQMLLCKRCTSYGCIQTLLSVLFNLSGTAMQLQQTTEDTALFIPWRLEVQNKLKWGWEVHGERVNHAVHSDSVL